MNATAAERLIDLAISVMYPKAQLLDMSGRSVKPHHLARVKLALKFYRLSARTKFVAITEEWPMDRIVKECY